MGFWNELLNMKEKPKKVFKLPEFVSFWINYYCEFCFLKQRK